MFNHHLDDIDLDKLLNRIVTSALAVFALIVVLLVALLFHYAVLQNAVVDSSTGLLEDVIELQDAAQDLQAAVGELNTIYEDDDDLATALDNIDRQLEIIDENLEIIEQNIELIAPVPEEAALAPIAPQSVEEIEVIQRNIRGIFTVLAWVISGLGVGIAVMLYILLNSRRRLRSG
jgi:hypothetical protein